MFGYATCRKKWDELMEEDDGEEDGDADEDGDVDPYPEDGLDEMQ